MDEFVERENEEREFFEEGKVKIAISASVQTFYNPVQEFNRDLTVLVLKQFVEDRHKNSISDNLEKPPPSKRLKHQQIKPTGKIQILDALSASGLRAFRFSKEVPDVDFVVANDFSEDAVQAIKENAKLNGLEHFVKPSYGDAVDVMMAHRKFDDRFHVIDLDPYGSAANFLDSAVQAVADGGLLMVTCTDTATLCGNTPEACFNKYASVPLRHKCCHEFALRILLKCIDSHAARHGRYIKPILSVSVDFYIRCFVQMFTSAVIAKDSVTKVAYVRACTSCRSLEFQPLIKKTVAGNSVRFTNASLQSNMLDDNFNNKRGSSLINTNENGQQYSEGTAATPQISYQQQSNKNSCAHCGVGPIHLAGPIYTERLHDQEFVERLLKRINTTPESERLATHDRLAGLITVVSEEVHDVPLYYESDQLMNVVRCGVPKHSIFRSAILNAGYRCSISHCNPRALKTDAPVSFLWDVCCGWAKRNKMNPKRLENYPAAQNILSRKISEEISFVLNPLAIAKSKTECLLRFPDNHGKNWGPKAKAKGSITSSTAQYQSTRRM